eukprot:TRINITY_DN1839_c0_g1_i8.p1 TRINITY_DN1839_c0_g1~~TRINITY_DN1839_c0_g1_i8.p1  ORF type:complete len:262 (-),score=26.01 TRINITY_DN1839_c0_g1_i8:713-1498(-)
MRQQLPTDSRSDMPPVYPNHGWHQLFLVLHHLTRTGCRTCYHCQNQRKRHPSLLSVMMSGGPYHTTPLEVIDTYVGGYEGKSLFQWLRSDNEMPFKQIPGTTQPTYYANPDELHTLLRVEVVPVRENGVREESMYADMNPKILTMDPEVAHTAETNVRNGKAAFRVQLKIYGSIKWNPVFSSLQKITSRFRRTNKLDKKSHLLQLWQSTSMFSTKIAFLSLTNLAYMSLRRKIPESVMLLYWSCAHIRDTPDNSWVFYSKN